MAKGRELATVVENALVDKAEALVRDKRVLARAKLPMWKQLAPAAQTELVQALLARGLEAGDKGALRVPLREQTATLVQGGARPTWKLAQKRIFGASPKDREGALAEAFSGGALHLVVRTKVDTVVSGRDQVLSKDHIERLAKAHEALGAVLKVLRKKPSSKGPLARVQKTLLREDALSLLAPFSLSEIAARASLSEAEASRIVEERIRHMEEPPARLVWVPDLVRSLEAELSVEQAFSALSSLRRSGRAELRPESGIGRLSAEEAALCPLDPDNIPLSHVRLLPAQ